MKREQTSTERKFNKMVADLSLIWAQYELGERSLEFLSKTIFKDGRIRKFNSLSRSQRKWVRDIVDDINDGKIKKKKQQTASEGKMETQTAMTIETGSTKKKRKTPRHLKAEHRIEVLRLAIRWICLHNKDGRGDTEMRERFCRLIETSGRYQYADGGLVQWDPAPKAYTDGPAYRIYGEAKNTLMARGIEVVEKEHQITPIIAQDIVDLVFKTTPAVVVTGEPLSGFAGRLEEELMKKIMDTSTSAKDVEAYMAKLNVVRKMNHVQPTV